jgi:hypothetical protein
MKGPLPPCISPFFNSHAFKDKFVELIITVRSNEHITITGSNLWDLGYTQARYTTGPNLQYLGDVY